VGVVVGVTVRVSVGLTTGVVSNASSSIHPEKMLQPIQSLLVLLINPTVVFLCIFMLL
jgi:hypothetical protein